MNTRAPARARRAEHGLGSRKALEGYGTVTTHLLVDLELRATLFRRGRPIFGAGAGIGKESWPTPRECYVRNKLTDFASAMYGSVTFGTSARSSVLTEWPAGLRRNSRHGPAGSSFEWRLARLYPDAERRHSPGREAPARRGRP